MARQVRVAPGAAAQAGLWPEIADASESLQGAGSVPAARAEQPAAVLTAWPQPGGKVAPGWAEVVTAWQNSAQGQKLAAFLGGRLAAGAVVYPPEPLRALQTGGPDQVRVVIVGQDPYHGPGQAEGLAFSVAAGMRVPPSLRNIFKELVAEGEMASPPAHGSLQRWAQAGVLLLNTCLSVEEGQPASHAGKGWEALTDAVLAATARSSPACVFLLWGAHAQAKAPIIDAASRAAGRDALILQANHPSPLSARRPPVPFLGCGHFRQARIWLAERGHVLNWIL